MVFAYGLCLGPSWELCLVLRLPIQVPSVETVIVRCRLSRQNAELGRSVICALLTMPYNALCCLPG